jgi:hypothetical protein
MVDKALIESLVTWLYSFEARKGLSDLYEIESLPKQLCDSSRTNMTEASNLSLDIIFLSI